MASVSVILIEVMLKLIISRDLLGKGEMNELSKLKMFKDILVSMKVDFPLTKS